MNRETNPELVRKISRLQFEVCSLKGQLKAVMADRDQAYQALNIERTASDATPITCPSVARMQVTERAG